MSRVKDEHDITTKLVHAGERLPPPVGLPVSTPIYATATFTYDSMAEVDQVFAGERAGYVYTRYGNPTTAALEEAVRTLEGGAAACAYASGMAALHAALFACELRPGSTVLASQDLYGATTDLLYTVFGSFGVKTVTADFSRPDELREKAREARPRVLVAETISNPLLKVCDIEACAGVAREAGARLIVDNTFASPYLCRPLKHGADMVVHSATKYLGGHADAMGGALCGGRDLVRTVFHHREIHGASLDPMSAYLLLRGMKTLSLRIERQNASAMTIARWLERHPRVSQVNYPGLESHPQHEIAAEQMRGFGGMLSFALKGGFDEVRGVLPKLKRMHRAANLGAVETVGGPPATTSHVECSPEERAAMGIPEGLIRYSVGIEAVDDLMEDLAQALG
jgi:cystathionine beta-lyase/cystathionine gamma-synthase